MLVLSRYINESITIGDDVIVTVVRIDHGKVRLAITAPSDVKVHRMEVAERIAREQSPNPPIPKGDI